MIMYKQYIRTYNTSASMQVGLMELFYDLTVPIWKILLLEVMHMADRVWHHSYFFLAIVVSTEFLALLLI